MNLEAAKSWIGLKVRLDERLSAGIFVQREFRVVDIVGSGAHNVVFEVEGADGKSVIKFPKTHLGFVISLPPDQFFPEISNTVDYARSLCARLRALHSSPSLARILPLEELWTALAVQHLPGRDLSEQTIQLEEYDLLAESDFVVQQLTDWSSMDAGKSEEEMLEITVIHQGERQIHAGFPQSIAKEARNALAILKRKNQAKRPPVLITQNPFLPWIAAGASGYTIPSEARGSVSTHLSCCKEGAHFVKQAAQVWRYAVRPGRISFDQMMSLLQFFIQEIKECGPQGGELTGLFLESSRSSSKSR